MAGRRNEEGLYVRVWVVSHLAEDLESEWQTYFCVVFSEVVMVG